jgi:hypothetical protein
MANGIDSRVGYPRKDLLVGGGEWEQAPAGGRTGAEQSLAGDGVQPTLRFSFPPRLKRSVRWTAARSGVDVCVGPAAA